MPSLSTCSDVLHVLYQSINLVIGKEKMFIHTTQKLKEDIAKLALHKLVCLINLSAVTY